MRRLLLVLALGCGSAGSGPALPPPPGVVTLLPNLDDDDRDGEIDFEQDGLAPGDDDLWTARVRAAGLRVVGPADAVRIFVDGRHRLGSGRGSLYEHPVDAPMELTVELWDWSDTPRTLELLGADGEVRSRIRIEAEVPRVAHVLQPTEEVWVVASIQDPGWHNRPLMARLRELMDDRLVVFDAEQVDGDVWIQDELELTRTPGGEVFVLDSPRDPHWADGLGHVVPTLRGPDRAPLPVGDPDQATTFDGFGNLEASPPVEVDGVSYPDGRVIIGGTPARMETEGPDPGLIGLFERFGAQPPVFVDTGWLCVGHIDEIIAFIPDPSAPRGFRLLLASPRRALAVLDRMPPEEALTWHGLRGPRGHARPTAGSYALDLPLRRYNEDLEDQRIDDVLRTLTQALALTPDEVIRVPVLFEEWVDDEGVCGASAVIPNGINHLFITDADGQGGVALIPDPFMREPGAPQEADAFIQAWARALPASVRAEFIDVWDVYHIGAGEVHCATNQLRAPPPRRHGGRR